MKIINRIECLERKTTASLISNLIKLDKYEIAERLAKCTDAQLISIIESEDDDLAPLESINVN